MVSSADSPNDFQIVCHTNLKRSGAMLCTKSQVDRYVENILSDISIPREVKVTFVYLRISRKAPSGAK